MSLLGDVAVNPLINFGMGLLGGGEPNNPNQWGAGMQGGLLNLQAAQEYKARQERDAEMMQLRQQEAERQREQFAFEQQQAQQQAYYDALERAEKAAQREYIARGEWGKAYPEYAAKAHFAQPKAGTSAMQNAEALGLEPGSPEYNKYVRDVTMKANTVVNVGANKPLGADANKFANAEGQAPLPTMSTAEAVANGFRLKSSGEMKAEDRTGTIGADMAVLDAEVERASENYAAAEKEFKESKTPESKRKMDNAASAYKTALAGRANWRGEPSGEVAKRFAVPGALGRMAEQLGNKVLGGESIGSPEGMPTVSSDADYDALPSGAQFLDPEGNLRVKQ